MDACHKVLTSHAIVLAKAVSFNCTFVQLGKRAKHPDFVKLLKNTYLRCNRVKHSRLASRRDMQGHIERDEVLINKLLASGSALCHVIAFTCASGEFTICLLNLRD